MATPEVFNTDISYREEHVHPSGFAGWRERGPRSIPANLPIASFNYRAIKPLVDLIIVFLALPIVLPISIVVAAMIRMTSKGAALYRHRRIGQFQQPLYVWKFRTMYEDSDQLFEQNLRPNSEARREWSDPHMLRNVLRVTPVAMFLHKKSLA